MDPIIVVFVMATGSVALTAVLPIIFWFTQTHPSNYLVLRPAQTVRDAGFQVKQIPATPRKTFRTPYVAVAPPEIPQRPPYQVKPLPRVVSVRTLSNRLIMVAS